MAASGATLTGLPVNTQTGASYTLVLADAGKIVHFTHASPTFTIPANATVAFPIGTFIYVTSLTGVVCDAAVGVTGNVVSASGAGGLLIKVDTNVWGGVII